MSKSLEALENIKNLFIGSPINLSKQLDIIEKELKVIEIIGNHKLLNYILKNEKCASMYHLSKEKIDLLKEVFEQWQKI